MTAGGGDGSGKAASGGGVMASVGAPSLSLSLSILQNETRKMQHGTKFIREIPTEYSGGIFKKF